MSGRSRGTSGALVLLRHGQSSWNGERRFTGWTDVGLSEFGRHQAEGCGEQLRAAGLLPDVVHTSYLRRTVTTADLLLDAADRHWIPTSRSWRLNERHYGALQGQSKRVVRERHGETPYDEWRRSYDVSPPPLTEAERRRQLDDPRYAPLGEAVPGSESLKDVQQRLLPYWHSSIAPELRDGATVLVVAHSNTIRALVMHLERLSDKAVVQVNVPTGMPLVYELNGARPGVGRYLDPTAAATAALAVAAEGRGAESRQAGDTCPSR